MMTPAWRRHPKLSAAIILVLVVLAYQIPARMGFTIITLLETTRVNLGTSGVNPDRIVFAVGDSIWLDACISDGVDMWLLVHDCAKWHPYLFRWSTTGDGVVRRGSGKLYGVKPGHFTIAVRSLGHSDTLSGEIIEPVVLAASTYDTTLQVGEQLLVGSRIILPPGGRRRVEPFGFYRLSSFGNEDAIREERVRWAYPAAIRLTTHQPGAACFELTGYHQLTWLKVSVVDSSGMTRRYDQTVHPRELTCEPLRSELRPNRPTERAALPVSALADSDVAVGVRKAFALELCVARRRMAADTGAPYYHVTQALRFCVDSVDPLAPSWPLTTPGLRKAAPSIPASPRRYLIPSFVELGADYSVTFSHPVGTDSDGTRSLTLQSNTGVLELSETRTGPPFVYGPHAIVQGSEFETLKAALACANLYRDRNGRDAPSLDSLLLFAGAIWAAMDPGERVNTKCVGEYLHFRPRSPDLANTTALLESGQFTFSYQLTRSGRSFLVRPERWGETGLISYALDEPGPIRRTMEDRPPVAGDEFYDLDPGYWYFQRSSDARNSERPGNAPRTSTRCYGLPRSCTSPNEPR